MIQCQQQKAPAITVNSLTLFLLPFIRISRSIRVLLFVLRLKMNSTSSLANSSIAKNVPQRSNTKKRRKEKDKLIPGRGAKDIGMQIEEADLSVMLIL